MLTEAYGLAAERLAANAFRRGDSRGLIPCRRIGDDAACRTKFIRTFGRKAFRRPLEPEEVARYRGDLPRAKKTFLTGAQAVIEAMLQSPNFLFWLEDTPNPQVETVRNGVPPRLTFIWDTMPDDALLDSAGEGRTRIRRSGVERAARRMLDDPKARDGVDEFVVAMAALRPCDDGLARAAVLSHCSTANWQAR